MKPEPFEEFVEEVTQVTWTPRTATARVMQIAALVGVLLVGLGMSPRPTASATETCCTVSVEGGGAPWSLLSQVPLPTGLLLVALAFKGWKPTITVRHVLDHETRTTLLKAADLLKDNDQEESK